MRGVSVLDVRVGYFARGMGPRERIISAGRIIDYTLLQLLARRRNNHVRIKVCLNT